MYLRYTPEKSGTCWNSNKWTSRKLNEVNVWGPSFQCKTTYESEGKDAKQFLFAIITGSFHQSYTLWPSQEGVHAQAWECLAHQFIRNFWERVVFSHSSSPIVGLTFFGPFFVNSPIITEVHHVWIQPLNLKQFKKPCNIDLAIKKILRNTVKTSQTNDWWPSSFRPWSYQPFVVWTIREIWGFYLGCNFVIKGIKIFQPPEHLLKTVERYGGYGWCRGKKTGTLVEIADTGISLHTSLSCKRR